MARSSSAPGLISHRICQTRVEVVAALRRFAGDELRSALTAAPPSATSRQRGWVLLRDHALEKTIAHALAVDPGVDDDTVAVECFAGGHIVPQRERAIARTHRKTRDDRSPSWR